MISKSKHATSVLLEQDIYLALKKWCNENNYTLSEVIARWTLKGMRKRGIIKEETGLREIKEKHDRSGNSDTR